MKVSLKELKKYVNIDGISPEELSNKLTFAGIEVEEIIPFASGTNLVIGEVISCEPHPDSDHLHVTKVDIGSEILNIVCGAPNVRKGLKVIVAKVGAKLPAIEIKKGNIRGVESNGMLCSLLELGVDKKYLTEVQVNGIEELDNDAPVGETNVLNYLGIDDIILDLKPLANRPDANSLYCVAREVGTLFNREVNIPKLGDNNFEKTNLEFSVGINTASCSKFCARVVEGIKVTESPKWLKNVLNSSGIRSINNVVDIGNYVMLLTGQPLHMYDYDTLQIKNLTVRDDLNKDFVALDEKTYKIENGDICICSGDSIECLGGVMGSLHSETRDNTKNLVIEAAIFDSKTVRLTSNRLGLSSDSSSRFVKGINKFNQGDAILLAIDLLNKIGGVEKISQEYKASNVEYQKTELECTYSYINKRLGTNFENKLIKDTLTSLNFEIVDLGGDNFKAIVPEYRIDVLDKADLSEEVIRVLGLEHIESVFPETTITIGRKSESKEKEDLIANYLVDNGFYQIVTYTLVDEKDAVELPLFNDGELIKLLNPLTEYHCVVRRNLIPSLINTVTYNANRKAKDFKLFEISNVYEQGKESLHLSLGMYGNELYQGLLRSKEFSFYSVKGVFENLMALLGIEPNRYRLERVESDNKFFHPGRSAYVLLGKKKVGVIGELHPKYALEKEVKDHFALMELNLTEIFGLRTSLTKMSQISKFPIVERDFAFVVSKSVEASAIIATIKKAASQYSPEVEIFDIFTGQLLGNDLKSVAIRVWLNPMEDTLKDPEIVAISDKIIKSLESTLGAKLR